MSSSNTTNDDYYSLSSGNEDHVQVCVRIRPAVRSERDQGEILCWAWENNAITQLDKSSLGKGAGINYPAIGRAPYYFDHLFYPEHTNADIFQDVVKHVVNSVMNGFHGSVFTYGQTSSGKTFTMTGTKEQPGVIPQAVDYCFSSIHSFQDREFLVRMSYLEIYNEQVKDLLNTEFVPIKIQHDPKNGTTITGVKEQVVVNSEQTISLIRAGEAHRHTGATDMNEKSSRAHTLFKLTIESRERGTAATNYSAVRVSCLNLVDLAGSENAKQTNSKGDRALEARYINQSLLTLSTIIHKLSEEKPGMTPLSRRQHLPYRDSKLTRILQPSLDGNAQIAVICTISPVLSCADETNNTLKFATRAKAVKMNAKVNDVLDEKTLLKVYREEIETLKAKLFEMEMASKMQNSVRRSGLGDDDDEQDMLLQMITEMESMILKADSRKGPTADSIGLVLPGNVQAKVSPRAGVKPIARTGAAPAAKPSPASKTTPTKQPPPLPAKTGSVSGGSDKGSKKGFGFGLFKGSKSSDGGSVASSEVKAPKPPTDVHTVFENDDEDGEGHHIENNDEEDESLIFRQSSRPVEAVRQNHRVESMSGDDVGDKVLFGVSKMLAALKVHIGNKRAPGTSVRKGTSESGHSESSDPAPLSPSASSRVASMDMDLRLKQADNRFLQEELEKKDKMLAMLTEGLREVEASQQEWLATNQELSDDLEKALETNAWLAKELVRLQELAIKAGVAPALVQSKPMPAGGEEY